VWAIVGNWNERAGDWGGGIVIDGYGADRKWKSSHTQNAHSIHTKHTHARARAGPLMDGRPGFDNKYYDIIILRFTGIVCTYVRYIYFGKEHRTDLKIRDNCRRRVGIQ